MAARAEAGPAEMSDAKPSVTYAEFDAIEVDESDVAYEELDGNDLL